MKKCLRIAYRLLRGRFTFPCSLIGFYELTEMCFGCSPALAVEIFGNVILLDQSHASKNIWWIQRRNNGMMLSMILWIIRTEGWIICRSRRLMLITQTRGLIIYDIIRKPNSVSVSSYIFSLIVICKRRHFSPSLQKFENLTRTEGLKTKQTLNAISAECHIPCRYCIYHVSFTLCHTLL